MTPKKDPASTGDMDVAEFRRLAHQVADQVADYLEGLESLPVLPRLEPGEIRDQLPRTPPRDSEPFDEILDDYRRLIEPNVTHWQHPGFMAYFSSVASGPGILGEWLAAGLNSNVMFWRNAPSSTELEEVVVSWLVQMLGLPAEFDGMLTDTASTSTLTAVVAARHAVPGLAARDRGLAGRSEVKPLRLYCSAEAHSSVEKAAIVAGIGRDGVRRIEVDEQYSMRPERLSQALKEDRLAGWAPFCVVATLGTTSTTSVDPIAEIAEICSSEGLWLHVDAAYAGSAALVLELRHLHVGWERADSIVVNPHKWMFCPLDASLLLFRRPEAFRQAFSLVPEYLETREQGEVHNYHEYGIQLGRRFRALKLWMMIRYFGTEGFAERLREHCDMARKLASWVDGDPDWERLAPVPFSTVCIRYRPHGLVGSEDESETRALLDTQNEAILEQVNATGRIFLSHTKLDDRFTIRVTFGNPRATEDHLDLCWKLLQEAAAQVSGAATS